MVKQIPSLDIVPSVNANIIGIVNDSIDIDDPLEVMSSSHENMIKLAKYALVLPVKVGTVISKDTIDIDLEKADRLLKNYEGYVEAIIRGEYEEEKLIGSIKNRLPEDDENGQEDQIKKGRMVESLIIEKRKLDTEKLIKILSKNKILDFVSRDVTGFDLCNLSILIHREEMDKVEELLRHYAGNHKLGVKFEYVAPLPIYSFVD
ncbi:GvpL/GvpF family gas vesicle protein [Portibacter marinus]|uniref:GvpL/GvpF family gas vesicle protein n=1 Tax=Portibacter marinus TaxID=2898660 RepID=UPI001F26318F|nr:GvpL/GvpF family gas vesicle protein [Portibacter marinus]